MATTDPTCDCEFCRLNTPFEFNADLLDSALSGRMTLFAGAGISTESPHVLPHTFYEDVAAELGLVDCDMEFPDLMQRYCEQENGRYKLLRLIRDRFDNVEAFPELQSIVTRFHSELGQFYPLHTIVTTNWDTYFEDICYATPFVTDKDLVFWDDAKRRVLKIHGTVRSFGSIIATREDYDRRERELHCGLLGSLLKTVLATQTVVFIGYSMNDSDFRQIYNFVSQRMEGFQKQAYIVTPYDDCVSTFHSMGLRPILTDGTFFIAQLKKHAVSQRVLLPDRIYDAASKLLRRVRREHNKLHKTLSLEECPQMVFAACYQDGIIHGLERMLRREGSGEYSDPCRMPRLVRSYLEIQKDRRRAGRYDDVAYIEGYITALIYIHVVGEEAEDVEPPLYFAFGHDADIEGLEDFAALVPDLASKHKASYRLACRLINRLSSPERIEFHHPPWL